MVSRFDTAALRAGALTTLVFAVPFGLAAAWASNRGDHGLAFGCNLAVLAAFVIGSGVAAWGQTRNLPISHALLCAVLAYVGLAIASFFVAVFAGSGMPWMRHLLLLTLAGGCGLVGGLLGALLRRNGVVPSTEGSGSPRGSRR